MEAKAWNELEGREELLADFYEHVRHDYAEMAALRAFQLMPLISEDERRSMVAWLMGDADDLETPPVQ